MFKKLDDINSVKLIKAFPRTREQFLIEDIKNKINWKIGKEKKIIVGYTCYKASGEFRGRKYIVWFTSEIPVSLGPWKLDGLPGLILNVEDIDGVNGYEAIEVMSKSLYKIPQSVSDFLNDYDPKKIAKYQDYIIKEDAYLKSIQEQSL